MNDGRWTMDELYMNKVHDYTMSMSHNANKKLLCEFHLGEIL